MNKTIIDFLKSKEHKKNICEHLDIYKNYVYAVHNQDNTGKRTGYVYIPKGNILFGVNHYDKLLIDGKEEILSSVLEIPDSNAEISFADYQDSRINDVEFTSWAIGFHIDYGYVFGIHDYEEKDDRFKADKETIIINCKKLIDNITSFSLVFKELTVKKKPSFYSDDFSNITKWIEKE